MNREKKVTVHWILNSPSPYNADLFRAIHNVPEISFKVYFHHLNSKTHFWKSDLMDGYDSRQLRGLFSDPLVRKAISKPDPDNPQIFMIAGWDNVFNIVFMFLLVMSKTRYIILSDTPNLDRKTTFVKAGIRAFLLKFFFRHSHRILTTGMPAVEAFAKLGADRVKIVNFPYWIKLERYEAAKEKKAFRTNVDGPNRIIFVSSGRIINELKGYDIALQALAIVNGNLPESCDFEYRIMGDGPDIDQLRQLATELGLAGKIKFLGWLETSEAISELAGADCFIHASPVHEPYGVVIIEAMAVGLVVFASDSTMAAIDRIKNGENGFTHPSKDYGFLAKQILNLLANVHLINKIAEAAYQTSKQWPMDLGVTIVKNAVK